MPLANTKPRIILAVLLIITLLTSITLTVNLGKGKLNINPVTSSIQKPKYPENQTPTPDKLKDLKSLNILLLGYGGAGHDGGYLTDVIQILHISFDPPKLALISIPRDLWVTLPNGKATKINQGFTLGDDPNKLLDSGGQVAKTMAEVVTGLPIHYFVAIDFVGFQKLIGENLDGIEVEVAETLDDPWYPIKGEELNTCNMSEDELTQVHDKYSGFELEKQFDCRYEQLHFEKGKIKMEGGDALKYVRSRHGSSNGDFSRSKRQAEVLQAIKNKLLSLDALENSLKVFGDLSRLFSTDLDSKAVEFLTPLLKAVSTANLETLVLSTDNVFINSKSTNGQFILLPQAGQDDWSRVHDFIKSKLD